MAAGKRLLVLLNPRARSGRAGRLAGALEAAFSGLGLSAEFILTERPGHARELAAAWNGGADALVCAGGDGTLSEVVDGLCSLPRQQRPPLGLLPLGTGNAFARELGLRGWHWQAAAAAISAGHTRSVDVAAIRTAGHCWHSVNAIGSGLVVDVLVRANQVKWLGPLAYSAGVLWALAGLASERYRLLVDGEPLEASGCLAMVANSRYTGADFLIAPGARVDDGRLDLVLVGPVARSRLLRLFPSVFRGAHVDQPEVLLRQARRVSVIAPGGLRLAVDGDLRACTPVDIECLPAALEMFTAGGNGL